MEFDIYELVNLYGFHPENIAENPQEGNCNQSYIFKKDKERFILRVSPPNEDYSTFQQKMNYLCQHFILGSPVVEPVMSTNKRLVEEIVSEEGTHLLTVTKQTEGITYELLGVDTFNDNILIKLGENLAKLHNNSSLIKEEEFAFTDWSESENCFTASNFDDFTDVKIISIYSEYRERCISIRKTKKNYGIIHGDLHFSNIIINQSNDKITFCDFDDACHGYFIMDLAMIVFDLGVILQCNNKAEVLEGMVETIIAGYNSETAREEVSLSQLQDFMKLIEISIFIQYYDFYQKHQDTDGWLRLFFTNRIHRILTDIPYLKF